MSALNNLRKKGTSLTLEVDKLLAERILTFTTKSAKNTRNKKGTETQKKKH